MPATKFDLLHFPQGTDWASGFAKSPKVIMGVEVPRAHFSVIPPAAQNKRITDYQKKRVLISFWPFRSRRRYDMHGSNQENHERK